MKKFLVAFFVVFGIACGSCTGSNKAVMTVSYDQLTAEGVIEKCNTPDEVYDVPSSNFPMTAKVIRHQNCLGLTDVLMITWPGAASEKNLTAAKLLTLMYVEFHNKKFTDTQISVTFLKSDNLDQGEGSVQIAFYEVKVTAKTKSTK